MTRTWTDAEIGEQWQRLRGAMPNVVYYERGRYDCMTGTVVPPPCSTTERIQWDEGWRHEMLNIERPFGEEA